MQIPSFPEANHPLIQPLFHHSDLELLTLLQRHPEQGKYFIAIFCRYSPLIYTIIRHSARSRIQSDYLFAQIWRHLYYEMQGLNINELDVTGDNSLQSWLIKMVAVTLNQVEIPPVKEINYDLKAAPPPFWCHLEIALNKLPPIVRLMVLMAQTFHWSESRIAEYLQEQKENLSVEEVKSGLKQGYKLLETALPDDIRMIYLYRDQ
ncbi:sigma-70 family RNA polymerase sigma factor [Euhalothece natronophila Z-M001]|uniref:Sigma-70 family RNA polymerase sigma factor n=1 Tax=Euhalothece natronophila Z-M001 TaxID=522448 RepID=A0A5B8NQU1_9CHRO|nr:sigma factor-like helix-turn-helix DNA-binding protein [Euhalothece natronophila]QDZ40575.1 sigma-70 family RNA polymerase sigma factor [Euhalothece natronophila Z-M001]